MRIILFMGLLLATGLIFGCSPQKNVDDSSGSLCPPGKQMTYSFSGSEMIENGCKDIADDAGESCTSSEECTYSCKTNETAITNIGCDTSKLLIQCPEITGVCEAIPEQGGYEVGEFNRSIGDSRYEIYDVRQILLE